MTCRKCGGTNVNVQVINEVELEKQHHGIIWWIFVGWWWIPFKWLFLTLPALIVKIFGGGRKKAVNRQKTVCVCQDCGYKWEIK